MRTLPFAQTHRASIRTACAISARFDSIGGRTALRTLIPASIGRKERRNGMTEREKKMRMQGSECVRFADVRPFPDDFCSRAERRTDEGSDIPAGGDRCVERIAT